MNPASQVRQELASFGLHTPYLIDATGSVSRAYGALGKGMHSGLPRHGFVLIDASGTQRRYGEYPSMYLSTAGMLAQVRTDGGHPKEEVRDGRHPHPDAAMRPLAKDRAAGRVRRHLADRRG
jgi:hypothetical protein